MNGIGSLFQSSSSSRLTGLSGFDSESVISSLMDAEKAPLTLLQQKRQVTEWRQEAYRDITTTLRGLKSTFFDALSPSGYLLSDNAILSRSATSSSSAYVTASASANAELASHLVKVNQLATADTAQSQNPVTKTLAGVAPPTSLALAGQSISLTLDTTTKVITLEDYADLTDMETKLQEAIDTAFGTQGAALDKILVDTSSGSLQFATANGASRLTIGSSSASDATVTILGFAAGDSNRISTSSSLDSLSNRLASPLTFVGDDVSFSINGKSFSFSKTTSLATVMSTVNADSTANVRMTYDETTDAFSIKSKQFGAGDNIQLSETGSSFFSAFGIDTSSAQAGWIQGQDASVEIDGQTLVRSSNTLVANGVSYTLVKVHEAEADGETVTISQDVDAAIKKIANFVDKYNTLLDTLYGKTTEKYDREYLPLTDTQREAMSEKEIEAWEKKAKTGLLQNDSIVAKITQDMRKALSESVEGAGLTLKDIGITSTGYQARGKLTIDESALREAFQNKSEQVATLLNGNSVDVPVYNRSSTAEQRATRYNQSGLFQRIADLVEDNISTIRDSSGKKGVLLEKAGITGDLSATSNSIYLELENYDSRIETLLDKLTSKENAYYRKFAALESALQRMNEQSSWLTSQLGG